MVRHFLRRAAAWSLAAVVLCMCGCSLFPESLQPQNLGKLNRFPAPSRDPFFSVQDPMAVDSQVADPSNAEAGDASVKPESL